jgi:hypothetical protein
MKTLPILTLTALAAALLRVTPEAAHATFIVTSIGGDNTAASIQTTVDAFRLQLGNPNNVNNPGPLLTGRREINWDGGGAATTATLGTLLAFQNIRGAAFNTPGTGFVQAPTSGLATQFNQAGYATDFGLFSAQRLFTPIDSNVTDVTFFLPGSNGTVPAFVNGFGAVFSDVDLANTTRLQFFDLSGSEIFNQTVTPSTVRTGGLSFLGAKGNAGEQIGRIRITTGNVAPGVADSANFDVVTMDDFLFTEPIPEPSTALFGLGLLGACLGGRRRR